MARVHLLHTTEVIAATIQSIAHLLAGSPARASEAVSKADRVREEIGWLKLVFGLLVVSDISLIAWTAQNYARAERVVLFPGILAIVFLSGAVAWVNHLAIRRFRALEKL